MRYNSGKLAVLQTTAFRKWLDGLDDRTAQVRIAARLRRESHGNLGDWRQLDRRIGELRVHHGPGYRAYFARRGDTLVLLTGGDKFTQPRDIAAARDLLDRMGEIP
jgi:putative addiction module killer protein